MKKDEQKILTDQKLLRALDEILQEKDGKNLSVDLICRKAKVHHQTFYHHFESKMDFYQFSLNTHFKTIIDHEKHFQRETLINNFCYGLFISLKENENLLKRYLSIPDLKECFNKILSTYLKALVLHNDPTLDEISLEFIVGGIINLLYIYINHSSISIEEISASMDQLMKKIKQLY